MFNKTSFTRIDTFCRIRSIILLDAQFYRSKIDHKIRIGDTIVLFGGSSFLFCWSFLKDLYGKLGWRFVGRNDICFNLKIEDNMFRAIISKWKEKVVEAKYLNRYFQCRKSS
jgi:hypothetical protein